MAGQGDHDEATIWRLLEPLRYVILVPVVLLLLAAVGSFVYSVVLFVEFTIQIVQHPFPVARNVGAFLVEVDILLVGTTLIILAAGLYQLFLISPSDTDGANIPGWLRMEDLHDLKSRALSMIVLVTAVTFADVVVDFQEGVDVLYLGAGIAVVTLALTAFVRYGARAERG